MTRNAQTDLTNCDREPIHIPGSIQPHGALLVMDAAMTRILRRSANAAEVLDLADVPLGAIAETLLGPRVMHDLRNALAAERQGSAPALLFDISLSGTVTCDIAIHRQDGGVIVEFERTEPSGISPLQLARRMIDMIRPITDEQLLIETSARLVARMLGYDRAMVYEFQDDGSGCVKAETKRRDLESFLGQYFPATDIPVQARALYLKNTIRIISDASGHRVPIEPELDASGAPLDLSHAHLRSVSPIHCEYLRNMGVAASMSVSIIVEGKLWGLLACHHYAPRPLPMALRVAAEMFGHFLSLELGALRRRRKYEAAKEVRVYLDRLVRRGEGQEPKALLQDSLGELAALVSADGAGLLTGSDWVATGTTPSPTAVKVLVAALADDLSRRVWSTDALSEIHPPADAYYQIASGVLLVPISRLRRDYLVFFRREIMQSLNWAGNPDKTYESGPMGDRLTPRKSFEIWRQTVRGHSRPWTHADLDTAEAMRGSVSDILLRENELLADERARAEVRQRMLNDELNHRVKNVLALVKSLVNQPIQEGADIRDYAASLRGRIIALSHAHDQVARGGTGGGLSDLLSAELSPYHAGGAISLRGPAVGMDARCYSVMALVFHEMATNAAKYGALSRPEGRLDVDWTVAPGGGLDLVWRETGGPAVSPPSREGFGTSLLSRAIPQELGGEAEISYPKAGLIARLHVPAEHLTEAPVGGVGAHVPLSASATLKPEGLNILLLEDQVLIAMDVEAMLAERGFVEVTTAQNVAAALQSLADFPPDIAILDINLGKETSFPVADALTARGIPFVFATGYDENASIPEAFSAAPIVKKPYDIEALVAALAAAQRG